MPGRLPGALGERLSGGLGGYGRPAGVSAGREGSAGADGVPATPERPLDAWDVSARYGRPPGADGALAEGEEPAGDDGVPAVPGRPLDAWDASPRYGRPAEAGGALADGEEPAGADGVPAAPGRLLGGWGEPRRYGRPGGARGWSGVGGAAFGAAGGMPVGRVWWAGVGLPFGPEGVSPVRGGLSGRGGALRRRLVVSGSVSARAAGRQGATGGWCVGRGGRSGRGRGAAEVRPAGGASVSRAVEGGGGGAMGSVASREEARRCGNRGGAASVAVFDVGEGAAGAPGGVEPDVTGPPVVPGVLGVRPDLLAASPVGPDSRRSLSTPFLPAPGAPGASSAVPPVPSEAGGSVGGGVAGRGGMEVRRASVLMHPPFPRTGAGPRSPCGAGRGRPGHAYPRGRAAIRARTSARGGFPCVKRHSTG